MAARQASMNWFVEKIGWVDAYRTVIVELQGRIQQNSAEIRTQLGKLGEYLSYREAQPAGELSPEMAEQVGRIRELREQLPASQQQVKRIMQLAERNAELEAKLAELRGRSQELSRRGELLCEQIGRAAFEDCRLETPRRPEFEEVFGPLSRLEDRIEGLEAEVQQLKAARGGGFLHFLHVTGRSLVLRIRLAFKRMGAPAACREAGRRFCASDLAGRTPNPAVQSGLSDYRAVERDLQDLGREAERIRADQSTLWVELKTLGAEKSHQRRVRELEQTIQRIEGDLAEAGEKLGSLYRAGPQEGDEEAARYLKRIEQAEKANAQHRRQIERIEAAVQIDTLERQIRGLEDRVDRLEKEIRKRQEEIVSLQAQIADAETQKKRLVKVRGPEQTLLALPDGEERT
jgi:chromosome segregation ATPase